MEYYDSNNDDKFIYYKNKIVFLHSKANVIDAMNRHVAPPMGGTRKKTSLANGRAITHLKRCFTEGDNYEEPPLPSSRRMKELQSEVCVTEADVHEILDTQDDRELEQEIVIEKDMKKQHNNIQKRLIKRIKAKQCITALNASMDLSMIALTKFIHLSPFVVPEETNESSNTQRFSLKRVHTVDCAEGAMDKQLKYKTG